MERGRGSRARLPISIDAADRSSIAPGPPAFHEVGGTAEKRLRRNNGVDIKPGSLYSDGLAVAGSMEFPMQAFRLTSFIVGHVA